MTFFFILSSSFWMLPKNYYSLKCLLSVIAFHNKSRLIVELTKNYTFYLVSSHPFMSSTDSIKSSVWDPQSHNRLGIGQYFSLFFLTPIPNSPVTFQPYSSLGEGASPPTPHPTLGDFTKPWIEASCSTCRPSLLPSSAPSPSPFLPVKFFQK